MTLEDRKKMEIYHHPTDYTNYWKIMGQFSIGIGFMLAFAFGCPDVSPSASHPRSLRPSPQVQTELGIIPEPKKPTPWLDDPQIPFKTGASNP